MTDEAYRIQCDTHRDDEAVWDALADAHNAECAARDFAEPARDYLDAHPLPATWDAETVSHLASHLHDHIDPNA